MGPFGPTEIIIILVIALVVFGPKRLPEMGKSLGKGIREFKSSVTGEDDTRSCRPAGRHGRRSCPRPRRRQRPSPLRRPWRRPCRRSATPRSTVTPARLADATGRGRWRVFTSCRPVRRSRSSSTSTSCARRIVVTIGAIAPGSSSRSGSTSRSSRRSTASCRPSRTRTVTTSRSCRWRSGVTEKFTNAVLVAFFAGLMIALPVVFWQIYAFIIPAFNRTRSASACSRSSASVSALFLGGAAFGYVVVLPAAVQVPDRVRLDALPEPPARARLLHVRAAR